MCFTPLFTYKVLKLLFRLDSFRLSFTPLFTYKVLKHLKDFNYKPIELYTFIYLQGSQTCGGLVLSYVLLYTFIYLQGSQTSMCHSVEEVKLYTFIYLQGSQTM